MGQLDASIVTLALPRIGAGLGQTAGAVRWVSLAYMLVLALTLVPVGLLADRFGRKLLYTYGFAVFTLGSVLCGLAPTLGWLIAARVLQGVGAAMLQANSVALIVESLPPRLLPRGLGVQGAAQAVGLALGPAIGGLLLALGGWQLIFLVNLPAGILGIALAWVLLPRSRTADGALRGVGRGEHRRAAHAGPQSIAPGESPSGVPRAADRPAAPRERFDVRGLAVGGLAVGLAARWPRTRLCSERSTPSPTTSPRCVSQPRSPASSRHPAGRPRDLRTARRPPRRARRCPSAYPRRAAARRARTRHPGCGQGGRRPADRPRARRCRARAFIPVNNATVMRAAPRSRVGVFSGILNTTRCLGTALGVALPGVL